MDLKKEKKSFWGVVSVVTLLVGIGYFVLSMLIVVLYRYAPGPFSDRLFDLSYKYLTWIWAILLAVFSFSSGLHVKQLTTETPETKELIRQIENEKIRKIIEEERKPWDEAKKKYEEQLAKRMEEHDRLLKIEPDKEAE